MLDVREMLRRLRLGESARAVAKGLGVSRNTVREYSAWFESERLLPGEAASLPTAAELEERLARAEPVQVSRLALTDRARLGQSDREFGVIGESEIGHDGVTGLVRPN